MNDNIGNPIRTSDIVAAGDDTQEQEEERRCNICHHETFPQSHQPCGNHLHSGVLFEPLHLQDIHPSLLLGFHTPPLRPSSRSDPLPCCSRLPASLGEELWSSSLLDPTEEERIQNQNPLRQSQPQPQHHHHRRRSSSSDSNSSVVTVVRTPTNQDRQQPERERETSTDEISHGARTNMYSGSGSSASRSSGFGDVPSQPQRQAQARGAPIPPPHLFYYYYQPHHRPQIHHRSRSLGYLGHSSRRSRHPWEPPDDDDYDPMASLFPSFLTDLQPNSGGVGGRPMHAGPPQQNAAGVSSSMQHQQQSSQSQQQHATNGINSGLGGPLSIGGGGGGAAAAAAAAGGGAGPTGINVYPTAAGHQLDLNYLWQQVQELSAVLQQNREATQGIIRSVVELQRRAALAAAENGGVPGEISIDEVLRVINENTGGNIIGLTNEFTSDGGNTTAAPASTSTSAAAAAAAATIADLRLQVQNLTDKNAFLNHEVSELTSLLQAYEAGLGRILELVRNFSHENTAATLAIHRNYNEQLAAERQTNLELRQEYIDFQARLVNLGGILREGLRYAENDTELQEIEMWAGLRHENRVLRRLVGLPVDESDDGNGNGDKNEEGDGDGEDRQSAAAAAAAAAAAVAGGEGDGGSGSVVGGGDGASDGGADGETQQEEGTGDVTSGEIEKRDKTADDDDDAAEKSTGKEI